MSVQEARLDRTLVGRILGGKFRLRDYIGAGSSGTVFKADQINLDRTVAVKILKPQLADDSRLVTRFHDEARAASKLNHPNTLSVIDYGKTDDGLLYIVMEYLQGMTLSDVIAKERPLRHERMIDIAAHILCGLEEAHAEGVVHADMKPENIVVDHRRGSSYVKVVDFGIAWTKNTRPTKENERTICGTPEYMAPEVIRGEEPTYASDLYAVGIILYEMFVGTTPFVGGPAVDVLMRHLREEPVAPSVRYPQQKLSRRLEQAIMRALSKRPEERFASATEFRTTIEATLNAPLQDAEEQVLCTACGMYSAVRFKYCPECGHPRTTGIDRSLFMDTIPNLVKVEQTPRIQRLASMLGDHLSTISDTDEGGSVFPLPLVGRDELLDTMTGFVGGDGAVVMQLSGVTGSGRSRLLQELRQRLEARDDLAVFCVAADPTGLKAPLFPIRSMVAAILAVPPVCPYDSLGTGLELLGLTQSDLPGIAELFGYPGELWELDPEVRRHEVNSAAIRVLKAAATNHGKAVLLFDDFDRYDEPSRQLLRQLGDIAEPIPLRVIVGHSTAQAEPWSEHVVTLSVPPLTEDDFAGLAFHIEQVLPESMPRARELAEITAGSPHHLQHLVRYLVEDGNVEQAPQHLADLIAARINNLPHEARICCQAVAVFGHEVSRDTLRHTLGIRLDGSLFKTALSLCRARGLLYEANNGSVVGFAHALVRDVTYDATPANVRRELHTDAVKALASTVSDPLVLGHHYDMIGNLHQAAEQLLRAGDHAVRELDHAGAVALYQRALAAARQCMLSDVDGDNRSRFVHLSIKLANALRLTGEFTLTRGILDEAHQHAGGKPAHNARLRQAWAYLSAHEGDFDTAIDNLRRGIGLVIPVGDMELLIDLYLDLSAMCVAQNAHDEAVAELGEALDLVTVGEGAETDCGPTNLWRLLLRLAQLQANTGDLAQALPFAERALFHAHRVRSRIGAAQVQVVLAAYYEQLGDNGRAESFRQAAVDEMRRLGDRRDTADLLLSGVVSADVQSPFAGTPQRRAQASIDRAEWPGKADPSGEKAKQIKDLS